MKTLLLTTLLMATTAFSAVNPNKQQFYDMQYMYHFGQESCIETFSPENAQVSDFILSIPDAYVGDHKPGTYLTIRSKETDKYWVFFRNLATCYEFKYTLAQVRTEKKAY